MMGELIVKPLDVGGVLGRIGQVVRCSVCVSSGGTHNKLDLVLGRWLEKILKTRRANNR